MLVIRNIQWSRPQPDEEDREKHLVEPLKWWLRLKGITDCQISFIPDAVNERLTRYCGRR